MQSLPPTIVVVLIALVASFPFSPSALAQIGQRFASEKKIVPDPMTGAPLSFLTGTPAGDSKIYPTHPQWTADAFGGQSFDEHLHRSRARCMAATHLRRQGSCVTALSGSTGEEG